jgi:hypothetical protein
MSDELRKAKESDFLFYTGPDGTPKIEVYYADETVWLTQDRMATLFNRAKTTIRRAHHKIFLQKVNLRRIQLSGISGQLPLTAKHTKPSITNLDVIDFSRL